MAMIDAETQKRIKALRKKVAQIDKLKEKSGLSPEETEKVASEPAILKEIWALENGVPLEPEVPAVKEEPKVEEAPPPVAEPEVEQEEPEPAEPPAMEPAEAEKRIKALKKKLVQIQKLKDRGGNFTPEELEKVASEPVIEGEVAMLEIGLLEPEAKKSAMALQKKLNEIKKLKAKGGQLTSQEREKVSKLASVKREMDQLLAARPVFKQPEKEKPAAPAQVQKAQTPAQQKPVAREAVPAPAPRKESRRERWEPPEETDDFDDFSGIPDVSAPYQAGAVSEDTTDFEDGFVTKQSKFAKMKVKAAEKAAAAAAVAEAAALEAAAAEAAAAEAAALQAVIDEAAAAKAKVEAEKAAAIAAEKAKVDAERTADAEKAAAAQRAEVEAEQASAAAAAAAAEAAQEDSDELEAWQRVITPAVAVTAPAAARAAAAPAVARAEPVSAAAAPVEPSGELSPEKRIKALRKKLAQVAKLKQRGGVYTPEEAQKIASEATMEAEIRAIENGEPWPPVAAEPATPEPAAEPAPALVPEAAAEPEERPSTLEEPAKPEEPQVEDLSPEEAQKRIRNLKKKLKQITSLKERGGAYTAEEQAKLDGERKMLAEVAALEKIA